MRRRSPTPKPQFRVAYRSRRLICIFTISGARPVRVGLSETSASTWVRDWFGPDLDRADLQLSRGHGACVAQAFGPARKAQRMLGLSAVRVTARRPAAAPVLHLVAHVDLGRHQLVLVVELAQANDVAPGLHLVDVLALLRKVNTVFSLKITSTVFVLPLRVTVTVLVALSMF